MEKWREIPDIEEKIVTVLQTEKHLKRLNQRLENYHQHLSKENISDFIESLLAENTIS